MCVCLYVHAVLFLYIQVESESERKILFLFSNIACYSEIFYNEHRLMLKLEKNKYKKVC